MNAYIELIYKLPHLLSSPSKILYWWVVPLEKLEAFFQFFLYVASIRFNMLQNADSEKERSWVQYKPIPYRENKKANES